MTPPTVSIIIPSLTGRVDALVAHLRKQVLKEWQLVVKAGVRPASLARNLGAREAQGEVLIFLDDDVELGHERVLDDLVAAVRVAGPMAVVGAPWRLTPRASRFQRWVYRDSMGDDEAREGRWLQAVTWEDSVSGACMAMRRDTFERLDGFDGGMIAGEEPEMLYRLTQQGGRVYLLGTSWVFHGPPASMGVLIRKTCWYEHGNVQLVRKHPEANHRLPLRNRWHAAMYLALRTAALVPLIFLKVSYRYRRPRLAFRPLGALASYIGAWAYCRHWFATSGAATAVAGSAERSAGPGVAGLRSALGLARRAWRARGGPVPARPRDVGSASHGDGRQTDAVLDDQSVDSAPVPSDAGPVEASP